jgi:hypothetical protein
MRGLSGKRGPLKPDPDSRGTLAFWFLLVIPAFGVAFSLLRVWFDSQTLEQGFLTNWLMWTPLMWGLVGGEALGRRMAAVVGYHPSYMFGRLLELVVAIACFALCSFVGALFAPPRGVILPLLGAGLFVVMWVFGFVRTLIGK